MTVDKPTPNERPPSFYGWTAADFLNAFFSESLGPLTSSKGFADLLLLGAAEPLTAKQQEIVQRISNHLDHMVTLRQTLLDEYKKCAHNE